MKYAFFVSVTWVILTTIGCVASYADRAVGARQAFYDGNVTEARKKLEENLKKGKKKENDLVKLENAMIDLSTGRFREAKQALCEVRDRFDDLEQKSLAENTLSLWTDDTIISYAGEDYEKIMVRVLLAMAELMDGGADAEAFALQIVEKQEQIRLAAGQKKQTDKDGKEIPNPKLAYKQVPLGLYLRGLIREETLVNNDDAVRYYSKVMEWEPQFQQARHDLQRAQSGRHHAEGNGVVYIFTLVGRGPYKERENAEATQFALLIADQIFSATNKYSVPPTFAPVPIPTIRRHHDPVKSVGIYVDGSARASTETITDIGQMAEDQFEAIKDQIIAKAVVRRIVKKGTIYAAKNVADVNPWISLAMDAGGVAWEALETADTRCWGLLPDRIQVARIELPAGEHSLTLQPLSYSGIPVGPRRYTVEVNVKSGYNSYVLANFPTTELAGKVLVR